MERDVYFEVLYPLQDRVLELFAKQETGFYLSGGTAASRGYLNHRLSDDLDLFVNDDTRFGLWSDRLVQASRGPFGGEVRVLLREERFVRFEIASAETALKIELVNDVPAHAGAIRLHPVLGKLDSPENLLANKLTALVDRAEPKDLADVWGFCVRMGLSIRTALTDAQGKAVGLFPADVARMLLEASSDDWRLVRWIDPPPEQSYRAELRALGEELLLLER